LATVCALIAGCDAAVGIGGIPTVSKAALQTDIAARLAKADEQPQSVTCGEDLVGPIGKTTRCEVVMSATNSFEPVITVTGVAGDAIDYEMSPSLSKDQLEQAVSRLVADAARTQVPMLIKEEVASSLLDEFERQTGRRPDSAQCAGSLEGRPGNTVDCTVVTDQDTASYTLKVSGVSGGSINYSYTPRP
jgi:Domain of unknown function (DUF4333)